MGVELVVLVLVALDFLAQDLLLQGQLLLVLLQLVQSSRHAVVVLLQVPILFLHLAHNPAQFAGSIAQALSLGRQFFGVG